MRTRILFLAALALSLLLLSDAGAQTIPNILTWNDNNNAPNNETSTAILRGIQGQAKAQIQTVTPDVTTYTDNFPVPAVTTVVCYQVVAVINTIGSPPSNEACKTIKVPSPASNLTVQ